MGTGDEFVLLACDGLWNRFVRTHSFLRKMFYSEGGKIVVQLSARSTIWTEQHLFVSLLSEHCFHAHVFVAFVRWCALALGSAKRRLARSCGSAYGLALRGAVGTSRRGL